MNIEHIHNHDQLAKDRILEQYKKSAKLIGLITSFVSGYQEIEDVLKDLRDKRSIDSAEGVQLDRLGKMIGAFRIPGQSDAEYLIAIKARIIHNLNEGTPEEVIEALRFFTTALRVWYLDVYPASVELFTTVPVPITVRESVRAALKSFLPAGVRLDKFGDYNVSNPLILDGGGGLGDTDNPATGGLLANVYGVIEVFQLGLEDGSVLGIESGEILTTG